MSNRYQGELVAVLRRMDEAEEAEQAPPEVSRLIRDAGERFTSLEIEMREGGLDPRAAREQALDIAADLLRAAHLCLNPPKQKRRN